MIGPKSPRLSRTGPRRWPRNAGSSAPCEDDDDDSDKSVNAGDETGRARYRHNMVEKQYRSRLSAQFRRLLAVLPAEIETQEERGTLGQDPAVVPEKRTSKAELLGMAMRRIKALERQNQELLLRQSQLLSSLEVTGGAAAAASCISTIVPPTQPSP